MANVICVGGEALVDLVPAAGGALRPLLGGGPYNVAITVGRLGVPVRFLSRLSTDVFGEALHNRLELSGVDTSMVQRGAEATTLAVVGIGSDGSARYSFYVTGTSDRFVADPGELPAEISIVSLGSFAFALEPGATTYETVLRRHRGLTVLDPNIRSTLIDDPDAYRARFVSWLPDIDLLKLSVEDAAWLAPGSDPITATAGWLQQGPAVAVLTRGADSLLVLTATGDRVEVPTVPATVVDTIGAGDTVHGALLSWLHTAGTHTREALRTVTPDGWRDALTFAARAAAVTVSRAGAEPPYAAELGVHP